MNTGTCGAVSNLVGHSLSRLLPVCVDVAPKNVAQRRHLRCPADRDPCPTRQAEVGSIAHREAFGRERVAEVGEREGAGDKVRLAREEGYTELLERRLEQRSLLDDSGDSGGAPVLATERCGHRRERKRVHAEGWTRPLHCADQCRVADGVPDAQTCESPLLREGALDEQICPGFAEQERRVRVVATRERAM